MLPAGRFS